jgi:Fe-S cluster biogenesis protein NfuA
MTDQTAIATREERIRTLIEGLSSYIETYHGGWVQMVSLKENRLVVRMGGACEGCALSLTTLQGWVGGTVKQFFPEITEIISEN